MATCHCIRQIDPYWPGQGALEKSVRRNGAHSGASASRHFAHQILGHQCAISFLGRRYHRFAFPRLEVPAPMALINIATHEIHCKIVYYGIGYCGKTTNLQYVFKTINPMVRGEMLSIATETERTLFFDFLPLDLGTVHGFRTRFHLYTVPGQILYERTRLAVLNGADGIVFVADSQAEKFEENVQSISELEINMRRTGKDLGNFPFIMQWNKRDIASALPINVLDRYLNRRRVPSFEAIASDGKGVFATLRAISKNVMAQL